MANAGIGKYYLCKILSLAFVVGISQGLVGCGKSHDEMRDEIIKCSSFITILKFESDSSLSQATMAALDKERITGDQLLPIGISAKDYTKDMDSEKVNSLKRAGTADIRNLIKSNDANGIAAYLKSCAANYKELNK